MQREAFKESFSAHDSGHPSCARGFLRGTMLVGVSRGLFHRMLKSRDIQRIFTRVESCINKSARKLPAKRYTPAMSYTSGSVMPVTGRAGVPRRVTVSKNIVESFTTMRIWPVVSKGTVRGSER